jgi:siroheme synthase
VKVVEAGPGDHQYLVCKLDNFKATIMIHDHPVGAEIRALTPPRAKETPDG